MSVFVSNTKFIFVYLSILMKLQTFKGSEATLVPLTLSSHNFPIERARELLTSWRSRKSSRFDLKNLGTVGFEFFGGDGMNRKS